MIDRIITWKSMVSAKMLLALLLKSMRGNKALVDVEGVSREPEFLSNQLFERAIELNPDLLVDTQSRNEKRLFCLKVLNENIKDSECEVKIYLALIALQLAGLIRVKDGVELHYRKSAIDELYLSISKLDLDLIKKLTIEMDENRMPN